jgi:hypothetical protein
MEKKRPPESVELVTEGMLPLQSFVVQAIPLPPGTPPRPRPDRPPFVANDARPADETPPEGKDSKDP